MNEKWIHNGISEEAVNWANKFGEELASRDGAIKPMTTSQLRKFYGELRRIDTDFNRKIVDLPMLQPMLAYAVGRDKDDKGNNKTKIAIFEREITKGLKAIRSDEQHQKSDFKNFVKLFEAIVAYHKFYGGI